MNNSYRRYAYVLTLLLLASCRSSKGYSGLPDNDGVKETVTVLEAISSNLSLNITTDKCCYAPCETVTFSLLGGTLPAGAKVRYRHLDSIISESPLLASSWQWTAPPTEHQGYLAEVFTSDGADSVTILGTVAVDVSPDCTAFPRNGFVATFDSTKTEQVIAEEMAWLNRCHINVVQFQDWHYKHHWPCPVSRDGSLIAGFNDIANRINHVSVIRDYISTQHTYGMKSLFYNLAFGVLGDAYDEGVRESWNLYKDASHTERERHELPSSWKSNIYLVNPGNTEWQQYLAQRNSDVYRSFDFDGYQIDQLGYRGELYDYGGNHVDLPKGYSSFIHAMKAANPDKMLVMNAVSGYGAQQIAQTGKVGFLYNEVWGDQDQFASLYDILKENSNYSNNTLKTVFAAYMDYSLDNTTFNIPGVLLTDAVIFALGGSHLELGDHMLCREYFPYTGVTMSSDLKTMMERYYDFMTAYENLLRGQTTEVTPDIFSADVKINAWPPVQHQVTAYAYTAENRTVVSLLNFTDASSLSWRDMNGTQKAPNLLSNIKLTIKYAGTVKKVWTATPDEHAGAVRELAFTQANGELTFTVPSLRYWTMLVIE